MVYIYMLTFGVQYIDGKCYHIYTAYMDPMGNEKRTMLKPY